MRIIAIIAVLIACSLGAAIAFAEGQDHTCQGGHNCSAEGSGGDQSQDQGQSQDQLQGQVAVGEGGQAVSGAHAGASADADSHAAAVGIGGSGGNSEATSGDSAAFGGNQHQAAFAGSDQTQSAVAENAGNSLSTAYESSFESNDRAYALALPGQTGAPAVAGECLEHKRGGSGLSIGVSGRTKLNDDCMDDRHCLALADRLAAWGQVEMAVRQLRTCGGVSGDPVIEPVRHAEPVDLSEYATREELSRAFEESSSK